MSILIISFCLSFFTQQQNAKLVGDTLFVTHPSMVFFKPTKHDVDSLIRLDPDFKKQYSDFVFYAKRLSKHRRDLGLDTVNSTATFVRFTTVSGKSFTVDCRTLDEKIGIIAWNGEAVPYIILGVDTDESWSNEILDYIRKN